MIMIRTSRRLRELVTCALALAAVLALATAGSVSATLKPASTARYSTYTASGPVGFKRPDVTSSRINVRWRPGVSATRISASAKQLGFKVIGTSKLGWAQLEPAKTMKSGSLATSLRTAGLVADAQPVHWYRATDVAPNDAMFATQWALKNTGQNGGTAGADTSATVAWSTTTGSKNVIVAVVDEGVNWAHPDLANNMWLNTAEIPSNGVDDDRDGYVDDVRGYDFANYDSTVYDPSDGDRHGTHVAGIIGAQGNNSIGTAGVNWHVSIMPIKFLGPNGGDDFAGAEAIVYAVDHGATAINCSWGGGGTSEVLDEAIAYAAEHGVLIVCAAGNDAVNTDQYAFYPGSSPATNVITVAASDRDDDLADFSNYGQDTVDIAAPGVDVTSTLPAEPSGVFVDSSPYKISYFPIQVESLEPSSARAPIITKAVQRLGEPTTTPILVVDDSSAKITGETQGTRIGVYTNALADVGFPNVSTWVTDDQGTPTESALRGKIVLWFTGKMSGGWYGESCINDAEQTAISQYLDNGGRLVMMSGEMAYDVTPWDPFGESDAGAAFLPTYFHVTLADYITWSPDFEGKAGTTFAGIRASVPTTYTTYDENAMNWPTGSDSICPLQDGTTSTQMVTSNYGALSGTSMAAPQVTGAVALLKAAFPAAKSDELAARIVNTVDKKPAFTDKMAYEGRLNLAAAMTAYPGRPTITSPKAGAGVLHAGEASTLRWRPAVGGSASATYSAEIGIPYSAYSQNFEDGSLSEFAPTVNSAGDWIVATDTASVRSGTRAAKSGNPGPATPLSDGWIQGSLSGMQTTVTVPAGGATLSFWWKEDCLSDFYAMSEFYVDEDFATGDFYWNAFDWTQSTHELTPGQHVLHWRFVNLQLVEPVKGATCVDDITLTAHAFTPIGDAGVGATSLGFTTPATTTADAWVRVRSNHNGTSSAWAYSKGVHISSDATATGEPGSLSATPDSDGHVAVRWTNPTESDFNTTRVLWSEDATPTGPDDPQAEVAYEGTGTATALGPLASGTRVYVGAFASDSEGNWSAEASASATVLDNVAPDPVEFLTARHRDDVVTLGWTPPVSGSYASVKVLARTDATPTAGDPRAATVYSGRAASAIDATAYPETVSGVFYSVYATDLSGNVSAVRSVRVSINNEPPFGTITLNDGEPYSATSIIPVHSDVTSATEMRIFTNGEYDPEALWQPYSADTLVTLLPIDGPQTVMAQFRNADGDMMQTSASIYVDLLAPDAPQRLAAAKRGPGILVSWDLPSDPTVVAYRVDQALSSSGPWKTLTPPDGVECPDGTFLATNLRPATKYAYRVFAIDGVGHASLAAGPADATTNAMTLTTPTAPSRAKKGRRLTASTLLFPGRAVGTRPVSFLCYRLESGRWKLRKTVLARTSSWKGSSSLCSAGFALGSGTWRLRARDVNWGVLSPSTKTVIVR